MRHDADLDASLAEALARAWMPRLADASAPRDAVDRLIGADAASRDPRLASLSLAWDMLARSRGTIGPAEHAALERDLQRLQSAGWQRAVRLGEAAMAAALHRRPERHGDAIALLERHGSAADDPRPPIERVWTDSGLSMLLAATGRHEEALAVALAADRLSRQSGEAAAAFAATRALSYLFLSTGDVEGALGVLPREIEASRESGLGRWTTRGNLVLAWLLAEQPAQAMALLQDDPWLLDPARHAEDPTLACLIACAHARCGHVDAALALLPPDTPTLDDNPVLRANRVWTTAAVHLAAGRAEQARRELQSFLAEVESSGVPLSPMNGTQIHRVLADACEALGDLAGALAALKASQRHCYSWVAASVKMRLHALHGEATDADTDRQQRRLLAIAEAERQVMDDTGPSTPERFVADVAHELRNPLNGVLGMTSLLMMSDLDERQRRYVQLAQSSARMMMRLCSDLLDLARLDLGHFSLNLERVNLGDLLEQAVHTFEPLATAKGLHLQLTLSPQVPTDLVADALRLQQVVMNLLSNAVKFSPAGRIDLRADWRPGDTTGDGWLRVEVQDHGPGLPADARHRLFREFAQFDRRPGGTGLGLALCRRLLDAMNGRIDVDNPPSGGSVFWFEVPLARAAISLAPG